MDFDAKDAREIVNNLHKEVINEVLSDIKIAAESGETVLIVRKVLSDIVVDLVQTKGFKITYHSVENGDDYYYSISW